MSEPQGMSIPDASRAATVAVSAGEAVYPFESPYPPGEAYPEYPFDVTTIGTGPNHAYHGVRESLRLLGLDAGRFGTCDWNPLGEVVRTGDTVVLKPNFVRDFRETRSGHDDCIITHGAVLRAVLDFACVALKGRGRLIIADAPQNDADFDRIREIAGLDAIRAFYREYADVDMDYCDLRPERATKIEGVIVGHTPLAGDPAGYVKLNVGCDSAFYEINHLCHLLYGSEYDMGELHSHQRGDIHEYLISKTVLDADCVISVPKFKTHKKVGLTVNLKNLVGINGNKNWLPHHREGTPSQGGDQFSENGIKQRLERSTVARFKKAFPLLGPLRPLVAGPIKLIGKRMFGDTNVNTIRSGNWYGNDTTWRMVLDLNRILLYGGADGRIHDRPQRRVFSIVDGIVGGEGNGPLDPVARPVGLVLAGWNPVAVDLACARLMGFDWRKIPMLTGALKNHPLPIAPFAIDDMTLKSNHQAYTGRLADLKGPLLAFEPHFGWKGHIEIEPAESLTA